MIQSTFTFRRGFSVGYSQEKQESLAKETEITVKFRDYGNVIVKEENGKEFTQGAYNGYHIVDGDYREYNKLKDRWSKQ